MFEKIYGMSYSDSLEPSEASYLISLGCDVVFPEIHEFKVPSFDKTTRLWKVPTSNIKIKVYNEEQEIIVKMKYPNLTLEMVTYFDGFNRY